MSELRSSQGKLAAFFLCLPPVPLPPAQASLLYSWLSAFIWGCRMGPAPPHAFAGLPPPCRFSCRPPSSCPPTLPCSAAAGPSRSPANQTPIVLPHLECSANCQPQNPRSASSARRRPRFIHKHWFLKGWCLCPQHPHWAYLETWSGRKSPRWLGWEGVSMIISEQEVGLASGRRRACIK